MVLAYEERPFDVADEQLVCRGCGTSSPLADRVLLTHARGCPLGPVLAEVEAAGKPLLLAWGRHVAQVYSVSEGAVS